MKFLLYKSIFLVSSTHNVCPARNSFDGSLKSQGIYFVWTTKVYTIAYAVKFTKTTRCRKVFMRIYHHHKIQYNNYICNGRQHKVKCGLKQIENKGINSSRKANNSLIYPWIFQFYSSCFPKQNIFGILSCCNHISKAFFSIFLQIVVRPFKIFSLYGRINWSKINQYGVVFFFLNVIPAIWRNLHIKEPALFPLQ